MNEENENTAKLVQSSRSLRDYESKNIKSIIPLVSFKILTETTTTTRNMEAYGDIDCNDLPVINTYLIFIDYSFSNSGIIPHRKWNLTCLFGYTNITTE